MTRRQCFVILLLFGFCSVLFGAEPVYTLPSHLYAVQGQEANVYFENVLLTPTFHEFEVDCKKGEQHAGRWAYRPLMTSEAGVYPFAVTDMENGQTVSSTLLVADHNCGVGVSRRVLYVTDSTGVTGAYSHSPLHELRNLFDDNPMEVTFAGTVLVTGEDAAGQERTVACEARAGWTWQLYMSTYSPFWSGVSTDFRHYQTKNGINLEREDWVIFHLGINDIANAQSDAEAQVVLDSLYHRMNAIIGLSDVPEATTIRGVVPGVRIGICTTIPPAASQDAWATRPAAHPGRYRVRRNLFLLQRWYLEQFDTEDYRGRGIHIVPLHVNLDTEHNMRRTDRAVNARNSSIYSAQSDPFHPAQSGSEQMADTLYAFLKCQEGSW